MDPKAMTRSEAALLGYLETRAVDYGGVVDVARMDEDGLKITRAWAAAGFIRFGKIVASTMPAPAVDSRVPRAWVELTDESWAAAAALRRARADRGAGLRTWRKAEDTPRTGNGG